MALSTTRNTFVVSAALLIQSGVGVGQLGLDPERPQASTSVLTPSRGASVHGILSHHVLVTIND